MSSVATKWSWQAPSGAWQCRTAATPNDRDSSCTGPTLVTRRIAAAVGLGDGDGGAEATTGLGEAPGAADVQQAAANANTTRPTTWILGTGYSSRQGEPTGVGRLERIGPWLGERQARKR
jgi:hypothetical protein